METLRISCPLLLNKRQLGWNAVRVYCFWSHWGLGWGKTQSFSCVSPLHYYHTHNTSDSRSVWGFSHSSEISAVLSHVLLFVTPWTVVCQAPLSRGLPRQEYWQGMPFPPPRDLPNPEIKPALRLLPRQPDCSLPLSYLGSRIPAECSAEFNCILMPPTWR